MPVETAKNIALQGINQGIKITHCDTSAKSTKSYDEYKERNLNDPIRRDAIDSSGLAGNTPQARDHTPDNYIVISGSKLYVKVYTIRLSSLSLSLDYYSKFSTTRFLNYSSKLVKITG